MLISTGMWAWVLRRYDRLEPEPIKVLLRVGLLGGLMSIIPAIIGNSLAEHFLGLDGFVTDLSRRISLPLALGSADPTDKASAEKLLSTSGNSFATTNLSSQEIRVNPEILKDGPRAVVTLAHELAHEAGRDGTLDHRAREERLLADVIGTLLGMIDTTWLTE